MIYNKEHLNALIANLRNLEITLFDLDEKLNTIYYNLVSDIVNSLKTNLVFVDDNNVYQLIDILDVLTIYEHPSVTKFLYDLLRHENSMIRVGVAALLCDYVEPTEQELITIQQVFDVETSTNIKQYLKALLEDKVYV